MDGHLVAAFFLNGPKGTMEEYTHQDGLVYLDATTMKLIAQLLQNSDVSNTLYEYLDTIRIDMEKRGRLPVPILACALPPARELKLVVAVGSTSEGVKIGQIFHQAMS